MEINNVHAVTINNFPVSKVSSMSVTDYSLTINATDNENESTIKINLNQNNAALKALLYKWVMEDILSKGNSYAYLYSDDSRQTIMRRIKDALLEMELEEQPF